MKHKFDGVLILIEVLYIILLSIGMIYASEEIINYIDAGGLDMTEEWIEILKTGVVGAAIGAVASMIGSYFMYLGKSKKILDVVEELKGERFNQLREDGKGILQKNDKLSSEHDKLSSEHDKLSSEHNKLSSEHESLKEELYKIYLNQETDKAAREAAGKYMPEEGKLIDLVKIVYKNHEKLIRRNAELSMKVQKLEQELQQYREFGIQDYKMESNEYEEEQEI